jgi:hypothetical protein
MGTKTLIAMLIAALPGLAFAGDATSTMAKILTELNHFPSAEHKASLTEIAASDASAVQKELAGIISRIAHQPGGDDKAALQRILAMDDAAPAAKTIAKAILNMNHRPQAEDLAALESLM